MKVALITLSSEGAKIIGEMISGFPEADFFLHETAGSNDHATQFNSVVKLTDDIFNRYDGLVYVAPTGAVVRAISRNLKDKKTDPAVVVVDVGGRHAVSLLSGHEGGANELAFKVGNLIGAEPVITTKTEAVKTIIVGVGCRKGKEAEKIIDAIKSALNEVSVTPDEVRLIASADIKRNEAGLISAAQTLKIPLRFISSEEIKTSSKKFEESEFVKENTGLPAVAEPAALLAGRRTKLILPKKKYGGITVAIAKESCSSLE